MSTHNICFYKEVKKKYTGCNLKTTEFLDCALIGVCAVIRSNTVLVLHSALIGVCAVIRSNTVLVLHSLPFQFDVLDEPVLVVLILTLPSPQAGTAPRVRLPMHIYICMPKFQVCNPE